MTGSLHEKKEKLNRKILRGECDGGIAPSCAVKSRVNFCNANGNGWLAKSRAVLVFWWVKKAAKQPAGEIKS
jgi:hypothetical protein